MRVLVTGSSGQLGREVARQLVAARHEVVGLDLVAGPWTGHLGSVADRDLVARLAGEVEAIVHTAGLHAPHLARATSADFERTNVEGTRALLDAAVGHGHRRFVFTSTTSVYGDALTAPDRAVWVTEDLPPRPRDVYDRTKLAAERLCGEVAARHRLQVMVLRIGRMFPEDAARVAGHRLHRGLDPRDAALAHVLALEDHGPGCAVVVVSARAVFWPDDAAELSRDAPAVIARVAPELPAAFAARGWSLPARIDRVHAIARAQAILGYAPRHGVASLLAHSADRWLYHLIPADTALADPYAPPSLATEGYVHACHRDALRSTAAVHFPSGADLEVVQLDPRRLGVAIDLAGSPRGPMPHVFGPIQAAAITARLRLDAIAAAPDRLD